MRSPGRPNFVQYAASIVGKIVYYALVLFVLQLAFGVFGANPISDLIAGVIAFLLQLLAALIIVVVATAVAAAVRDLLCNTLSGLSYGRMLANIASISIIALGVIAALKPDRHCVDGYAAGAGSRSRHSK